MKPIRRPRVLFVAGLTPMPSGGHGGQITAATALARSKLADHVEFVPLSSTMQSDPAPPLPFRARAAAQRLGTFGSLLDAVDAVLVFAADGLSVVEKGLMCVAARLAGRGVVIRLGSGLLPAQCEAHPALQAWLRIVLRSAHVVISQGPQWTRYFGSYPEAAGKIVEVSNGVAVPESMAHEPGRADVVFVGSMHKDKGIFHLLDAADIVRSRVPHVMFELIGGGRDLEEFRAHVARRGLQHWVNTPGWLPHEATLSRLGRADVFALPSYYEGLPNAMLEAMAAGLPVVVTPVGSIPDVVRHGENGILVPIGDSAALAAAIADLLADADRAGTMGACARATVRERYGEERVVAGYAKALGRALREAGRPVEQLHGPLARNE